MSQSIKTYELVTNTNPKAFSYRIQKLLDQGYLFHGTIVMSVDAQANRHFAQAMVLVDEKSPLCSKFK